jgi:hypothetical protein
VSLEGLVRILEDAQQATTELGDLVHHGVGRGAAAAHDQVVAGQVTQGVVRVFECTALPVALVRA